MNKTIGNEKNKQKIIKNIVFLSKESDGEFAVKTCAGNPMLSTLCESAQISTDPDT